MRGHEPGCTRGVLPGVVRVKGPCVPEPRECRSQGSEVAVNRVVWRAHFSGERCNAKGP